MATKKRKKSTTRRAPSLFALAGKNKAYKSAKRAKEKAEARAKKAWKKAMTISKKKLKALSKRRK